MSTDPNTQEHVAWFETIYQNTQKQGQVPPWSAMHPRRTFTQWAERTALRGNGKHAAVVGCGLGDDAEDLARRGFHVTAFDIAPSAVKWCKKRFPESSVHYQVGDLFHPAPEWIHAFDFVLEIFTIQALPISARVTTIDAIANLVAPGGKVFVYTLGADVAMGRRNGPPWSLTKGELAHFTHVGLTELSFEELRDFGSEPNLRFRALYGRE